MFQGLFKRAERSFDQAVSRIVTRAAVAVPLLVAGGFATAALTVKLLELYGPITGYALMAALFAVIGVATMAIVGVGSAGAPVEQATAEPEKAADTTAATGQETTDISDLLTPEMRTLLASIAPAAVPGLVRGVGRNLPLIFVLALVAFVISRFAESPNLGEAGESETGETDQAPGPAPDPAVVAATAGATAAAAAA